MKKKQILNRNECLKVISLLEIHFVNDNYNANMLQSVIYQNFPNILLFYNKLK